MQSQIMMSTRVATRTTRRKMSTMRFQLATIIKAEIVKRPLRIRETSMSLISIISTLTRHHPRQVQAMSGELPQHNRRSSQVTRILLKKMRKMFEWKMMMKTTKKKSQKKCIINLQPSNRIWKRNAMMDCD